MRNSSIAAILSVWTGLGQAYNGQTGKGLGLFAVLIIFYEIFISGVEFFSVLVLIVWVYSIYSAYDTATKLNSGALPYTEINFGQIFGFIVGSIILGFILTAFMTGIMEGIRYSL